MILMRILRIRPGGMPGLLIIRARQHELIKAKERD
jgi:hypothetical protein